MSLFEDHHVHSTFSADAVSSVAENIGAAQECGLLVLCLTDHVRSDTTWLPEYAAAVRRAAAGAAVGSAGGPGPRVLCGIETKVLDRSGRLDLPANLPPLDRVLIADHQYPGAAGPVSPELVKQSLEDGTLTTEEVVETVVMASANALGRTDKPQLAHLFSLLPKVGLTESAVGADQLQVLAGAARESGAQVEVNEKWGCPGPAAIAAFRAAGVPVVVSTDSHRADDVGRYRVVVDLLASAAR